jgi:hypothetical protein
MIRLTSLALVASCAAVPVSAQDTNCGPVNDVLVGLQANFGESPMIRALMGSGELLVMTVSEDGVWTALVITADGTACIVASGEALEVVPQGVKG